MVESGVDVNVKMCYGVIVFFYVCDCGYFEVVGVLFFSGVDLNVKDMFYDVIFLMWVLYGEYSEIV